MASKYELDKMIPGVMANWYDGEGCHWCHRSTWNPTVGHDGLCPVPALFALKDADESHKYELKMQTIRAEHAESDVGGVREEQWYEVRNRELEAEVERLCAELDDIHQCRDGLYYCAWAERLARKNDELKAVALKAKEMFGADDLWIDGTYGGARAVELRELVNKWFVDSKEPT